MQARVRVVRLDDVTEEESGASICRGELECVVDPRHPLAREHLQQPDERQREEDQVRPPRNAEREDETDRRQGEIDQLRAEDVGRERPWARAPGDQLVGADARELERKLGEQRQGVDPPMSQFQVARREKPQHDHGADGVPGRHEAQGRPGETAPVLGPVGERRQDQSDGNDEWGRSERQSEQHGHEHELGRGCRAAEDLELDPSHDCVGDEEHQGNAERGVSTRRQDPHQQGGAGEKAAAQKKRGKTLARHQAARSPGALLAYDLVCRRVERELRPDPEAGRGLVWRRRHTSVIGIAVKPLDDAGRLPRSSDASHPCEGGTSHPSAHDPIGAVPRGGTASAGRPSSWCRRLERKRLT